MQGTLRLDSAKFQAATVLSASLEIDNNYSNNVNDPMLFIRFQLGVPPWRIGSVAISSSVGCCVCR
jgi:hypothetical protein